MKTDHLLHLEPDGITLYRIFSGQRKAIGKFSDDITGRSAWEKWCAKHPEIPLLVFTALSPESCQIDIWPQLHGKQREQLITRRISEYFGDDALSDWQKISPIDASGPHRLILAGLPFKSLHPWNDFLAACGNRICVVTLGQVLPRLFRHARLPEHSRLVSIPRHDSLYQCWIRGQTSCFVRQVPLPPGHPECQHEAVDHEHQNVREYLIRQQWLTSDSPLGQTIIAGEGYGHPNGVSPAELAHRLNLPAASDDLDSLCLDFLSRHPDLSGLQRAQGRKAVRRLSRHHWSQRILKAASLLLFIPALMPWLYPSFAAVPEKPSIIDNADRPPVPPLPPGITPENVHDIAAAYRHFVPLRTISPHEDWFKLGQALELCPSIRLTELRWEQTDDGIKLDLTLESADQALLSPVGPSCFEDFRQRIQHSTTPWQINALPTGTDRISRSVGTDQIHPPQKINLQLTRSLGS